MAHKFRTLLAGVRLLSTFGAAVFLLSCGGGGGGTASSNGSDGATITARPVLSANSSDFSAGALDDDPASPTSARNILSTTLILPSINATQRIAATSTVATWGVDDIIQGKTAPVPSSSVVISPTAFNPQSNEAGHGLFVKANCTEYAFDRRDQLVSFLRSNGVTNVLSTLRQPQIRNFTNGADAKYWLSAYKAAGYKTGAVPAPGAIVVYDASLNPKNPAGHVAVVEKVWYDTSTRKIIGWYVSERNNSSDGQLKQTCFGGMHVTPKLRRVYVEGPTPCAQSTKPPWVRVPSS